MVRKSSELASPATATGALWGPSASRYEVVRYPALAVAPEWHELHCAAKSGATSSSQLTGWARSPCSGRAFEQEDAANVTTRSPWSARMGGSRRLVEVHEADRRDPIGPVANQALLLLRLGECRAARLPERPAVRLHVIDGCRAVVARRARRRDGRVDQRSGGWRGANPGDGVESEARTVVRGQFHVGRIRWTGRVGALADGAVQHVWQRRGHRRGAEVVRACQVAHLAPVEDGRIRRLPVTLGRRLLVPGELHGALLGAVDAVHEVLLVRRPAIAGPVRIVAEVAARRVVALAGVEVRTHAQRNVAAVALFVRDDLAAGGVAVGHLPD